MTIEIFKKTDQELMALHKLTDGKRQKVYEGYTRNEIMSELSRRGFRVLRTYNVKQQAKKII